MTKTKNIAVTLAYLCGISEARLEKTFENYLDKIAELNNNSEAVILRKLCIIRTTLYLNYKRVDDCLRYSYQNLYNIEYFNTDDITDLTNRGVPLIMANYTAEKYSKHLCDLINSQIDKCKDLFPDWIPWEYIHNLFCFTKYANSDALRTERFWYITHRDYYPFSAYLHYTNRLPKNGTWLFDDESVLEFLYAQHGEEYIVDKSKVLDADESQKKEIEQYLIKDYKTVIAVDCENSNPFKLYAFLLSLSDEEYENIAKITLYDDSHTTDGWDWLCRFIDIPVEHIEVERISESKSLVDIKMTAGVVADFYKNGFKSFLICSSDSDFWGLISSLPDADFLVLYEYDKCGQAIKEALKLHEMSYCAIDDYCTVDESLKHTVLLEELKQHYKEMLGMTPMELTDLIYANTKISATQKEKENFCNRFVKTLTLKVENGVFAIVVSN